MQIIRKWGNSLAVRIPREAAQKAGLSVGDTVAISANAGKVTIVSKQPAYRIEDFVKLMKPENQPELIERGPAKGKEFW